MVGEGKRLGEIESTREGGRNENDACRFLGRVTPVGLLVSARGTDMDMDAFACMHACMKKFTCWRKMGREREKEGDGEKRKRKERGSG